MFTQLNPTIPLHLLGKNWPMGRAENRLITKDKQDAAQGAQDAQDTTTASCAERRALA
ncbi:hypothetical protein [Novosphingobium taihuense]|uniref:Uncharacterized protein n=1 Tax=Novosphingobium taihuense TaxID=260085 RepID=A0A7W7AB03_9SPHN|nr:hypothetical protein [Novosphingobium taihuense]MBB4612945.1 hypothetical protein [Novosphingobium taihuense]TWH81867.1 hypothetical protein IQ25_03389 [Novosphingobium taihuense]